MSDSRTDLLTTKLDDYSTQNKNNYVASGEITVTITLNEYRELIKISEDRGRLQSKVWDLEKELKGLKENHKALLGKYEGVYADYRRLLDRESERENAIKQVQNNV